MSDPRTSSPGLVSIVICAWNNWPDLEMAIESALNQSHTDIEVIVVDNSSTDETPREVQRRYGSRIQYVCQTNRGDAGAYNTGWGLSRGAFIQFMDGDDVLAPNKIERQVALFHADPDLDIVYGDVRTFQTAAGPASWIDIALRPEPDMLAMLAAPNGAWLNTLSVLFRRRAIERVGPWDEALYVADADYWLRAAWLGCRFAYCPLSPSGFWRKRAGQMSEDVVAMDRGLEAVWAKALGYIHREPHRGLVLASVADWRFYQAVSASIPKRQALWLLARARATSPGTISRLDYVLGLTKILLPAFAARSVWGKALSRAVRRYRESGR